VSARTYDELFSGSTYDDYIGPAYDGVVAQAPILRGRRRTIAIDDGTRRTREVTA
jgi:hypothetical protein